MKKKLFMPPVNDREIIVFPDLEKFLCRLKRESIVATAHQPYFFNPGVSLKFILLNTITGCDKKVIFLDTDKVNITAKIPSAGGRFCLKPFIESDKVLHLYPSPGIDDRTYFFYSLREEMRRNSPGLPEEVFENIERFEEIFVSSKAGLLKDVLTESFIKFYGMKMDYSYASEIFLSKEFFCFFEHVYKDDSLFREIFNSALDEYKKEFRFRFKNFPFPKLEKEELPFWIVKDGSRERCFKKDMSLAGFKKNVIFPRAYTLTIFLRLYACDFFIHGTGGANYDWVSDRVIERFFKKGAPPYLLVSGTFLIKGFKDRGAPYFFFNPEDLPSRIFPKEKILP